MMTMKLRFSISNLGRSAHILCILRRRNNAITIDYTNLSNFGSFSLTYGAGIDDAITSFICRKIFSLMKTRQSYFLSTNHLQQIIFVNSSDNSFP